MTEFPLYCVMCEKIASHIYEGYSVCKEHYSAAKANKKRAAEMNDSDPNEGLSALFG